MRRSVLLVATTVSIASLGAALPQAPLHDPVSAAQGLVSRILGAGFVSQFTFQVIPADAGHDTFELDYANNTVVVRGNTGVAISAGLFSYLKNYCNATVSWGGDQLNLPSPLPRVPTPVHTRSVVQYRYAWNVCTASYTGYPWDWARWEREIDLMALWGVNLPLMFTGQEKVWQTLYSSFGITNQELQEYFSGPAFLAWQRMGNIRGWAGPLDNDWIEGQAALQAQILSRARSFGMTSVLPGFSGHVPEAVGRVFPNATLTRSTPWNSFNDTYTGDYLLEPTDPVFQVIGQRFYQILTAEFGTDHVYNSDTFNEMEPTNSSSAYLRAANEAVYNAMVAVDPSATYLMQGWLFHEGFWNPTTVQAYLSGVPNDSMIILDLNSEQQPVWNEFDSFYGKPFIWNLLHNYGGRRGMYGPLDVIASGPAATMATPGSSMVGIGYTPEAIEHNPIVYELLNEMAWHPEVTPSTPLDLNVWVERYAVRRYGANSPSAIAAWQILLEASYKTQWDWMPWSFVEHVPTVGMLAYQAFNATGHVAALRLLYQAGLHREGGLNPDSETFQYDLADLTRQVLANFFVDARQLNTAAFRAFQFQNKNSSASYFPTAATLTNLIEDMDEVLATSPYLLLGSWIGMARTSPNTNSPTEAANREFNARNQVTLWGPNGEIRDYAAKHWAGLVGDFYARRWSLHLTRCGEAIVSGEPMDFDKYLADLLTLEQAWNQETKTYPSTPSGDLLSTVSSVLANYASIPASTTYQALPNQDYPLNDLVPLGTWTRDLAQLMILCNSDPACVGFNTDGYLKNATSTLVPAPGSTFYLKTA